MTKNQIQEIHASRPRLVVAERPAYTFPEQAPLLTAALARALSQEDQNYLKRQPFDSKRLLRYARSCRKRFVALYLEERRKSFEASARVAREFAADSDAPELAFAVLRESIRFRLLSAGIRLSLRFNLSGPAWRLAESLVKATTQSIRPEPAADIVRA
jgi:hypothetical protein